MALAAKDNVIQYLNIQEMPRFYKLCVTRTSSGLGLGSREGWLWTVIMAGQLFRTASWKRC